LPLQKRRRFDQHFVGAEKSAGRIISDRARLMKCTSVFDSERKFNPTYDEKTTRKIEARTVILAVGQTAELGYLSEQKGVKVRVGRIEADEKNLSTGERGVFAGGDVVTGPGSIIQAMAQGRKAAAAIDLYLGGDGNIDEILARPERRCAYLNSP